LSLFRSVLQVKIVSHMRCVCLSSLIRSAAFTFVWLLPNLLRDLHRVGWDAGKYQSKLRYLCLEVTSLCFLQFAA
jgi:hypothetical protein